MWDECLLRKNRVGKILNCFVICAMKRAFTLAVCVAALLVNSASSQSYSNNRAQTISNIFQIPIQTLTAISNFAQNTRPLGEILQRRRNPQVQPVYPSTSGQSVPVINYPRSNAARIAGLYIASDGSGFRI